MLSKRLVIIGIGMIAMILLLVLRRKRFQGATVWKMLLFGVMLTVAGVVGTMLMYFFESGEFGGISFFGAVFFVPIFMLPALCLKFSYKEILNLCAPLGGLMLAIMKVNCLISNCCFGKYLPSLGFQFPSQIVEMVAALLVMIVLLVIEVYCKDEHLYGWFLILYGASRFLLNGFRYGIKPFVGVLSNGHFWALISVIIGIVWIVCAKTRRKSDKKSDMSITG